MTLKQINFLIGVLVGIALAMFLRTGTPNRDNIRSMARPQARAS